MKKILPGFVYFSKKCLEFIVTIFILTLVVFYMSRLAPGDPLKSYYGESIERKSTEEKEKAMVRLGLDKPIHIQYIKWIWKAFHRDFGMSLKYKQDVIKVIGDRTINTIVLGGIGFILTFLLALLLGKFCAFHEDKWVDKVICKIGTATSGIPIFWVALIFILIFSVNLRLLPSSGAYDIGDSNNFSGRVKHLLLPLTLVVINHLWYYAYLIRNRLLDEVRQDYVLLAKSKGLSPKKIMNKHCLRNIMPSYISIMMISVPHILGGTFVIEVVFSYPGIGLLSFESAKYHDYNMLMVLVLITGSAVVIGNLIGQVINEKIDPRMKQSKVVNS